MLTKGIQFIVLILLIMVLAWLGTCVYSNFFTKPSGVGPDVPELGKAAYIVSIENTGNILFTDDYEQIGSTPGKRTYTINGFWELQDDDFKYKESVIILDEAIFGKITIRRR